MGEVHGGGGFTDSSFLISDGDDFHELVGWRENRIFQSKTLEGE